MSWLHELRQTDRRTLVLISAAIDALAEEGPALGRPLVDTVKGSRIANLKELRPGSAGRTEVRHTTSTSNDCARRAVNGDGPSR
ncbi:type II toxin-antitoxin system RelE/ParE family toxin [Asanoa hainanensis]|uniref:type II toxin-antitoxin system RelE/ParE family toxin n=1 Tax=Asanoa hainanensis TaxID=560556 RepID=UPI00318433E1